MASPLGAGPVPVDDRRSARRPVLVAEPVAEPAAEPADPLPALLGGLNAAVLDGAGTDRVVERVAGLLGLPVALRLPDLGVRSWAAPPVFRLEAPPGLPAAALRAPTLRAAVAGLGPQRPSVVLPPAHGLGRRHLLAVLVVGGAVAGYLDVSELGRSLRAADTTVAEQAAAVLSVQLAGEARLARALARNRDDVLADLLRGSRPEADLRRLAAGAGLDLGQAQALVRFPVRPDGPAADCRGAVTTALAGISGTAGPPLLVEPDAVVGLVGLGPGPAPAALRALHRRLRDGLDAVAAVTGIRRVVVSGAVHELTGYPAALAETREVDGLADALGGGTGVVAAGELGTLRLVVAPDRSGAAARLAEQYLGPLRRSDAATGGDLVETLRHYLDAGAQVRAAAAALGVHENTVRYRLGRIEHLIGLDVRRFDALLAAQLAFQVDRLASGPDR